MAYRDELVQVAAVAIAAIQDFDRESTFLFQDPLLFSGDELLDKILQDVVAERLKQEDKWGSQHHHPEKWFTILGEEVGEVARDVLEKNYE